MDRCEHGYIVGDEICTQCLQSEPSKHNSALNDGLSCLLERALLMFNMAHENIEVCQGYSKAHAMGEAEALKKIIKAIEDEIERAT